MVNWLQESRGSTPTQTGLTLMLTGILIMRILPLNSSSGHCF